MTDSKNDFDMVGEEVHLPRFQFAKFRARTVFGPSWPAIIKPPDVQDLSVRTACEQTGIAGDFSRIRNANIGCFTVDRLMIILDRLGLEAEVGVKVHPRSQSSIATETHP